MNRSSDRRGARDGAIAPSASAVAAGALESRRLTAQRRLGGNRSGASTPDVPGNIAPPWWANPAILAAGFIIPMFTLVFVIPTLFGTSALQLRSAIYFEFRYFGLGLAFLFSLLIGCMLGQLIRPGLPKPGHKQEEYISLIYLELMALMTIGAYLIWFRGVFTSPAAMVSLIKGDGEFGNIRYTSRTIGGVTTFTQCGLTYIILYLDRVWGLKQPIEQRRFKWYVVMILGLTVFRAHFWAERLSLIEVMVPIGLLFFCYRDRGTNPILRLVRMAGPILGIGFLIVFFGMMEYFRSWSAHYSDVETSFWGFVMRRFLAYYYTALNNGAGLLMMMDWPTYNMEHVLSWVYRFPVMIGPIFRYAFDVETFDYVFLDKFADPEFNNMSGIFTIFYDMGVGGSLLYAGLWGCVAGAAYSSMRARRGFLRLLYPLLFLSILEVMRVIYLGDPRAFPAIITLMLGYGMFRTRVGVPRQLHQISRARRHSTVKGVWYRPRIGRLFGR